MEISGWTGRRVRVNRCSVPGGSSVRGNQSLVGDRERWLAQLSGALNDAQQVLLELDLSLTSQFDAGELFYRIEAARVEVRSLQLSRSGDAGTEKHPIWIKFSPWQGQTQEGC